MRAGIGALVVLTGGDDEAGVGEVGLQPLGKENLD